MAWCSWLGGGGSGERLEGLELAPLPLAVVAAGRGPLVRAGEEASGWGGWRAARRRVMGGEPCPMSSR